MGNNYVVEMTNITKKFLSFVANDSIDFKLKKGEIHALLGENGAGKSTLMSILFGLYQPTKGEIRVNGKKEVLPNANRAIELGIGMVHQHFKLVDPFTVTENIILGIEPINAGTIDYAKAVKAVQEISRKYGLQVDPEAKIKNISVGMQQRVEILKTLYRGADILIFDEPTAVLTPQEIDELLAIMRKLVAQGKSIILITHKLKEIMAIADTVTIIRRGKVIDSVKVSEASPEMLAEKMVGRQVSFERKKEKANPKHVVFKVQDVFLKNKKKFNVLDGIGFEVKAGEILGIAGVGGNGQSELIEAITGLRKIDSGHIFMNERDITNLSPRKIAQSGIAHIPQDRHKHGLVLDFMMTENIVLKSYYEPKFNKKGILNYKAIDEYASKLIDEYDVRTASIYNHARSLSGGNQQKGIIAREMNQDPELLIAAQPTRGLDVGAIEFIHTKLIEQRNKDKAVLLISYQLDEILQLSDRILVISGGKIVGEVFPEETNDRELGLMMAGSKQRQKG